MALINVTPTQPTLTTEQKLARTIAKLKGNNSMLFGQMVKVYNGSLAIVTANEFGLTSQQVLAGLGDDATAFQARASDLKAIINATVPGTIA